MIEIKIVLGSDQASGDASRNCQQKLTAERERERREKERKRAEEKMFVFEEDLIVYNA